MKVTTLGLVFALFGSLAHADAVAIRGMLVTSKGKNLKPAAGFSVTIYNEHAGRSNPSVTDPEGKYYLTATTEGSYFLEVWTSYNDPTGPPTVYKIDVQKSQTGVQDIPRIDISKFIVKQDSK
jgi:hypothetical protein